VAFVRLNLPSIGVRWQSRDNGWLTGADERSITAREWRPQAVNLGAGHHEWIRITPAGTQGTMDIHENTRGETLCQAAYRPL
jgi:hypothetical protein